MLSIVGTPIGNLEDISIRQGRVILDAEYVLAENTSSAGVLLSELERIFEQQKNVDQKVIHYAKENEMDKTPQVLELLKEGKDIALISEAGLPLFSDPGYLLVSHVIKDELPFTVIPGPTAAITALLHSGFQAKQFFFVGFLPKKENDIKRLLGKLYVTSETIAGTVFAAYESPNRILDSLHIFQELYPTAHIAVCRELTKKFEEVRRGTASELLHYVYKGEISLVFHFDV